MSRLCLVDMGKMGAALSTVHNNYQVGLGWKNPIFWTFLAGLVMSNLTDEQFEGQTIWCPTRGPSRPGWANSSH